MARRRNRGRAIDGIFLLNKPAGMSSNAALQRVKRIYGAAKAGHTGALDPLATGMLPICLGEATKFSHYLLDSDKRYITTAKLGIRTDSSDADGEVVATAPVGDDVTEERIQALLEENFSGEIEQVPSMFSALKFNGQPLYKLARQGIQVEVKPRQVTIHEIKMTGFRGDEVDLEVHCSKGTYIRSIVEDLGLMLGCGAHVQMLHRLDAGPYKSPDMFTMEQLESLAEPRAGDEEIKSIQARLDQVLLPPWTALVGAPELALTPEQSERISHGQRIRLTEAEPAAEVLLFNDDKSRFLGIAEIDAEGILRPKRLIASEQ
ncbi:tRNA pseudouridine(55) synthase TruB [Pontibacterium sp.]|uniref:tRNA pseudouridine(55) synthase TruB n=1 Tax=Pontibacterium sp. TaxID=2036026 RepID=UPI003515545A